MAGVQLNELPDAPTVVDADIFHLQTSAGLINKKVTKVNLLQDVQTLVDANTVKLVENITVLPLTGGGALSIGRVNDMQDTNTYTLPLANSVAAETFLDAMVSDQYVGFTPIVQRIGADTIVDSAANTWTDIVYDFNTTITIRYISDGVDKWRIA